MKRGLSGLLTTLLLSTTITIFSPAQAQQNCSNPKTDFDQNYCLRKIFTKADDDLNVTYKKLRARLGPVGRQKLVTTQRRWIAQRDAECQEGGTTYLDCVTEKTISRTNFLNDRLRECLSSGCLINRIN